MRSYRVKLSLFAATAMCASLATPAFAQATTTAADSSAEEETRNDDIIVTGTLIRGTQVTGSQTLSIDSVAIAEKGATSTNELLGLIPQITNTFNGRFEGDPRGINTGASINKPNLRNIPSANSTSGSLTLVLADGMRLTPVGVNQAAIDVDILPAAVMAGIDAVTDGGSSLYGADAVGGVLNFRTMKSFEGVKLDGNYGFGTTIGGYRTWDGAITAGKSWTGGNAYISVGHSKRDGILNGETSWSDGRVFNAAGVSRFTFTQCPSPVGTETRWLRFGPGAAQFTANERAPGAGVFPVGTPCDQTAALTYLPEQKRTNVFGSVSQEFGDNIDLRVTGYWTKRDTTLANFPRGFTSAGSTLTSGALVGAAFPGAAVGSITAVPGGTGFSFGVNPAYVNEPNRVGFETWGVTPEVTIKLGTNWQMRNTAHFGRSTNYQSFAGVDAVKAQCYITGCPGIAAGQLNPRNAAAASAAVISDITNYASSQDTKHQLFSFRSIVDGSLFTLPGGDAKIAVGVEYQHNRGDSRLNAGPYGSLDALPFLKSSRNAKSAFAEVLLPVASFVDVAGSVRYDDYSDFGSTTNPSIGLTLKPTSWLKVFGHWNTSFNAPTALDGLAIATGRFVCGIYAAGSSDPARRPTDPLGRDTSRQGTCAMVLQGSSPGLQPQTADAWAVGFEAKPVAGLRIGGEFYSIDLKNALGTLNPSVTSTYTTNADLYTYNVTAPQFAALLETLTNGSSLGMQQPASNIALIVDTRTTNLNAAKLEGVDFHAYYDTENELGRFSFGVSGTRPTKAFITNGGVSADRLGIGSAKLFASTHVGWGKGIFSSKITFNYTGKFTDEANNFLGVPETARAFIMTNLNLGVNFDESNGVAKGLSLRLIVDNMLNEKPQYVRRVNNNNPSFLNYTLGRVIKVGASVKF
jgi:iron complex outermembrane recepter protein